MALTILDIKRDGSGWSVGLEGSDDKIWTSVQRQTKELS